MKLGILEQTQDYIDLTVGVTQWQTPDGLLILEEDYRVSGEVWRVHLSDADPFPSKPHAHCIGGSRRFVGCKLHLGTADLYSGTKFLNRRLEQKQFLRLIELIRPKFPHIVLPLPI
jgi:hypothetical protein